MSNTDIISDQITARFNEAVKKFITENKDSILSEEMMTEYIERSIKDLFDSSQTVIVNFSKDSWGNGIKASTNVNPITAIVMNAVLPIFQKTLNNYLQEEENKITQEIKDWVNAETKVSAEPLMRISFDALAKSSYNLFIANMFVAAASHSKVALTAASGGNVYSAVSSDEFSLLNTLAQTSPDINYNDTLIKFITKAFAK